MPSSVESVKKQFLFHNQASANGNGQIFNVESYKTITVEITGSAANVARTITFKGRGSRGSWQNLSAVNMGDFSIGQQTTGLNQIWQLDVTGLERVMLPLSGINGGTVTVIGNALT